MTFISLIAGIIAYNNLEVIKKFIAVDGYDPLPTLDTTPVANDPNVCDPLICVYGIVTTYDASNHLCKEDKCWFSRYGAWWTKTARRADRWIVASKSACKKHPEWHCYIKHIGSYNPIVRPYYAKMTVYAAAGPKLWKLIKKAYGGKVPAMWHIKPFIRVRFWQVLKDGTVDMHVIYVVDQCNCQRMADFSPAAWELFDHQHLTTGGWNHNLHAEVILP